MTAEASSVRRRLLPLGNRNFRRFYIGYATSLFGAGMEAVAVAFAVLNAGGSPADLGLVIAVGVVVNVVCMLAGGVVADRFSRRAVMVVSDIIRLVAEGALAAVVIGGHPAVWMIVVLYAMHNAGYGFFTPAIAGLTPEIVEKEQLHQANVLIGFARDIGVVAGPAVAAVLVGVSGPGLALAVDAATYLVSVLMLVSLRLPSSAKREPSTPLADLKGGYAAWRGQSWIWITSVACSLFNAFVYAPFLVLGPVVAKAHLGGGNGWGAIVAVQGLGSVLAAPVLLRWSPRKPASAIIAALAIWILPDICLAVAAPVPVVAATAFFGGAALALMAVVWTTLLQRKVHHDLIGRVASVDAVVSYGLSPIGLLVAAAAAQAISAGAVLWTAAILQALMTAILLPLPAVRSVSDTTSSPDSAPAT